MSTKLKVSDISVRLWFDNMMLIKLTDSAAYLRTDNNYKKAVIEDRYFSKLKEAFEIVTGHPVEPCIISTETRSFEEQLTEILDGKKKIDTMIENAERKSSDEVETKEEAPKEEEYIPEECKNCDYVPCDNPLSGVKRFRANRNFRFREENSPKNMPKRYNSESGKMETVPLSDYKDDLATKYGSFILTKNAPKYNSKYTFENFVVGESNKLAYSACLSVAKYPAQSYNPLFIYGNPGLGKTHLLYSITNEIKKNTPAFSIVYAKSEDFTNELIKAITEKDTAKFRNRYRNADILLIDDIQFIGGKKTTQEEFFHTFDALYEANKQIIISSDRPPKEINVLEERIRSRFEWGLTVDIQPPDRELRAAIIHSKSLDMGITLPNDVESFIADCVKDNVRQLEGVIKKLKAYTFIRGEKITTDLARRVVADVMTSEEAINAKKVIDCVAKNLGVSAEDIKSVKRNKEIAYARHVFVYIMRELTDTSHADIGKYINREHSTVMTSYEKIKEEYESSEKVKELIDRIVRDVRDEQQK